MGLVRAKGSRELLRTWVALAAGWPGRLGGSGARAAGRHLVRQKAHTLQGLPEGQVLARV